MSVPVPKTAPAELGAPRQVVSLLDADPDLGTGLEREEFAAARRRAVVRVLTVEGPDWETAPLATARRAGWHGLFILDGLLVRRVTTAGRSAGELLGTGDVFRPWDEDGSAEHLACSVDFSVLARLRVAVLDEQLSLRIARWPTVHAKLIARATSRAWQLSLLQAITALPRTHARVLLLFWLLGERWGHVTPSGIEIRLPVTHQVLAMLIGCHRPTVTIALQKLARHELLLRPSPDRWVLTRRGIDCIEDPGRLAEINREGDL